VEGLNKGEKIQTLLGATELAKLSPLPRSSKRCSDRTLVIAHNKTLAANFAPSSGFFPQ